MIGRPSEAPAPMLAYECLRSWSRTSASPARWRTRPQTLSSAPVRWPDRPPAKTYSLPCTRGSSLRIERAGGLKINRLLARLASRRAEATRDRNRRCASAAYSTSPFRQPVNASNLIAAATNGLPLSRSSSFNASARRANSASLRNRCIFRTAGFLMPRAGLSGRMPRSTAN